MAIKKHTFTIWRGATFHESVVYNEADGITPVPLVGATATMPIKNKPNGTVLLTPSTTNGMITIDTTNGQIDLIIDATVTQTITWSNGTYTLFLKLATGDVDALLWGAIRVLGV